MIGCFHIVIAMKPIEGTFAENAMKHGVAGINVDECRIGYASEKDKRLETRGVHTGGEYQHPAGNAFKKSVNPVASVNHLGRFPANVILEDNEKIKRGFPESKSTGGIDTNGHDGELRMGRTSGQGANAGGLGDSGSAARFFYAVKEYEEI